VTEGEDSPPQAASAAELAAEAAGDDWGNLKPAEKPDELEELSLKLEEYLHGYGEKINVPLAKEDGSTINPYELALAELQDPEATVESRKSMIGRIDRLIKKLGAAS
jgi:hypothetical protein